MTYLSLCRRRTIHCDSSRLSSASKIRMNIDHLGADEHMTQASGSAGSASKAVHCGREPAYRLSSQASRIADFPSRSEEALVPPDRLMKTCRDLRKLAMLGIDEDVLFDPRNDA